MPCKSLYKGFFSFTTTVYVERCMAYTEKQAWLILCRRIAKKQGVSPQMVMSKFDGSHDNYSIHVEVIFEEVDSEVDYHNSDVAPVDKKNKSVGRPSARQVRTT